MRRSILITAICACFCQGCALSEFDGAAKLASADAASRTPAMMRKQASAPSQDIDFFDALFAAPVANKESVCVSSELLDVEEFAGAGDVNKDRAAIWQKSTLRLRVTHKKLAEDIFADIAQSRPGATNFSLGGFASLAGKDTGICSGLLVGGNIALSAGHCVLREHWENQSYEFPSYERAGEKVYFTAREFAKLLVVDFNRQLNIGPIADNSLAAYPDRPYVTFTVRAMRPEGSPALILIMRSFALRGARSRSAISRSESTRSTTVA